MTDQELRELLGDGGQKCIGYLLNQFQTSIL
jgi:hypothetical protein